VTAVGEERMGGRAVVVRIFLTITLLPVCMTDRDKDRVRMVQQQSCYYQPHNQELVCQCRMGEDKSFLHLKLREFMLQAGQEIKSTLVHSCPDLLLHLDFLGVNPSNIKTVIKNSQNIVLEEVTMDNKFKDRQQIKMAFLNIGKTTLSSFGISDAVKMTVTNVKEFNIINCSFSHIPVRGLQVNRADKLVIKDSRFMRVHPNSVVLEKTKVVEVVNNQFSVEAIQVINYKEGSSVFISCNRLLGDFIKPECFTTSTVSTTTITSTTTSTTTTTTTTSSPTTARTLPDHPQPQQSPLVTILIVLIILLLLVMLLVILAICVMNWTKLKKQITQFTSPTPPTLDQEDVEEPLHVPAPPPPPPPVELETLLNPQQCAKQQLFAPVWMDEIQNNKIFNKQKSINQELEETDDRKEAAPKKQDDNEKDDVSHDADFKENSRTESDQDDI